MGFGTIKQPSFPCLASIFPCLASIPLIPRVWQLFLTKGLCYLLVEDDSGVSGDERAKCEVVSDKESSSNVVN